MESTTRPVRQEALERYWNWQGSIPPTLSEAFLPLQLTMEEWGQEIFAYFSTEIPLTNAFTEAQNRLIRDASRTGFGLGFRTLRAKLLFSSSNTSPTSSKCQHCAHLPNVQPQEEESEPSSSVAFSTSPGRL